MRLDGCKISLISSCQDGFDGNLLDHVMHDIDDVPVSEVSELESTRAAHSEYVEHKARQRPLLSPAQQPTSPAGPRLNP